MLLRHSTDICPKEPTRDMRGYFNSLLEALDGMAGTFRDVLRESG